MGSTLQAITEHPFFKGIDEASLQEIDKVAVPMSFKVGEYLIKEGRKADQFYLISKGKISVLTPKLSRDEDILEPSIIQVLRKGDILGWSWFVPPFEWRFDARALEEAEVIALNSETLRELCENNTELGYQIMKRLALAITERLTAARLELATHHAKPFEQAEGG